VRAIYYAWNGLRHFKTSGRVVGAELCSCNNKVSPWTNRDLCGIVIDWWPTTFGPATPLRNLDLQKLCKTRILKNITKKQFSV